MATKFSADYSRFANLDDSVEEEVPASKYTPAPALAAGESHCFKEPTHDFLFLLSEVRQIRPSR